MRDGCDLWPILRTLSEMNQDWKASFLQMWSPLREPLIFLILIGPFQSHSPMILELAQTEWSSNPLCPACIPGERMKSREGKYVLTKVTQVMWQQLKPESRYFSSDSVNILLCHHQYHHHQRVSVASIICIMKYSPSPISSGEAGLRKWCQFPELCLGHRKWFINVSFIKDCLLPPVYRGPLQEHDSRRLWRADEKSVVGSQEGSQEGWGHRRRRRHAGVGKSRQTLPGPALSLLTESVDSSYKRTDSWLPKSL